MLIENDDEFTINDWVEIKQIQMFIKQNRDNPHIEHKALEELYSLYIYLYNLCKSECFSLPLQILKPDPPDFVLDQRAVGHKTGIEVVASATQSEKHAFSIMKREYPKGSLLESPCYVPGSRADLKEGIREPDEPLRSSGFGNYGKEKAWLDCIRQKLAGKTRKLNKNKAHYSQYQSNQLIIYDDTGYFPEVDYVVPKLQQDHKSSAKFDFNSVHIIMNVIHLFVFDVFGQCCRFNIPSDMI